MGEDRDINERVSTLEEQVRGIIEVKSKIDVLYNLLMEMKLDNVSSKADYAKKEDCTVCRREVDGQIEKLNEGRTKIYWALISSGSVFIIWLLEQLLNIKIQLG